MARTTEVVEHLVDDMDGGKAVETVAFAVDGVSYEIDLSVKNAKALRADLSRWSEHARKAKHTQRRGRRSARSRAIPSPRSESASAREWAAANGVEVSARGRIPSTVLEQYRNS